MKTASVAEVTADFAQYLHASQSAPVVVTRKGKPVAVLLTVDNDDDVERLALAHCSRLRNILARGHRQIREGKGVAEDEFWQRLAALTAKRTRNARSTRSQSKR